MLQDRTHALDVPPSVHIAILDVHLDRSELLARGRIHSVTLWVGDQKIDTWLPADPGSPYLLVWDPVTTWWQPHGPGMLATGDQRLVDHEGPARTLPTVHSDHVLDPARRYLIQFDFDTHHAGSVEHGAWALRQVLA